MFGLRELTLPHLPRRTSDSHKGTFGHLLAIGGSRGMIGSISMTAIAAMHSGAGLVTLAVPDRCLETAAQFHPALMTIPLPCNSAGTLVDFRSELESWQSRVRCLAIGPGMTQSAVLGEVMADLYQNWPGPLVIDADGLNNLASGDRDDVFQKLKKPPKATRILTPHPGEWQRLSGVSSQDRHAQTHAAIDVAKQHGLVIVLKGHHTIVTDGESIFQNQTGNPAMAVGGMGDVLTGILGAFVCQGLAPLQAAALAVHVHGLAGDLAHRSLGGPVILPTKLIDFLPSALDQVIS